MGEEIRPRHVRQVRFTGLGPEGQRALQRGTAAIVGVGALGTVSAETLARAGVGKLVLVDRDVVDETNLHRQVLFEDADAKEGAPKVEAARRAIARIDPAIEVIAEAADLSAANANRLLAGAAVVLDGTDNFETRYLLNEWSLERGVPWIYGAAVASSGLAMAILPRETACLRCVFPEPSPPEATATCETAGILPTASAIVAHVQATLAIQLLSGAASSVARGLLHVDPWAGTFRSLRVDRDPACPACAKGERPYLRGEAGAASATLCGRETVQVSPGGERRLDLSAMAARVPQVEVASPLWLRFVAEGHPVTLFPDGRALVGRTTDPAVARTLYARYVGS
ncbi:MAG TPA: ThiF family adenylyltransferase [Planctomycetota bacterium]|nr:ThiF family adenylyltransferase [Planctomycetota bacterium]